MRKKIKVINISLFSIVILFLSACSSTSSMKTDNENAIYSAIIYESNLRVDNLHRISGEKSNLQGGKYELESSDNIFNEDGDKIKLEDLMVGDEVEIYFNPQVVVKETSPGQISAEYIRKIVKSE